jgi:hypothetical protein
LPVDNTYIKFLHNHGSWQPLPTSLWLILSLSIYIALQLYIAWLASRYIRNEADYLLAGRSVGIGLAHFRCLQPGLVQRPSSDPLALWPDLACPVAVLARLARAKRR